MTCHCVRRFNCTKSLTGKHFFIVPGSPLLLELSSAHAQFWCFIGRLVSFDLGRYRVVYVKPLCIVQVVFTAGTRLTRLPVLSWARGMDCNPQQYFRVALSLSNRLVLLSDGK